MKRILIALALSVLATGALAQGCGPQNPQCIVPTAPPGTNNNQAASTAFVQSAVLGGGGVTVGSTAVGSSVSGNVLVAISGILQQYTPAQLTAQINLFTNVLAGTVPASGGGTTTFLRADGTWQSPGAAAALQVGTTPINSGTTLRVLYDNAGVLGEYTNTQLTALCQVFTSGLVGCVPSSGGGSVNFLRADGTFAIPGAPGSTGQVPFNNAGAFAVSPNFTFASPALTLGANGTATGQLVLAGTTAGLFTQTMPASFTTWQLTWPGNAGSAGSVLTTNGAGVASWTAPAAGGTVTTITPAGFLNSSPNPITVTGSISDGYVGSYNSNFAGGL